MFLVAGFKGVLSALKGVLSGTVIDMSRLDSERAGAEQGTRAVDKARATVIAGTTRGERVGFSRTKNREKGAAEKGDGSSTKGVLSHKLASLKVIRLLASISRSIWSIVKSLG